MSETPSRPLPGEQDSASPTEEKLSDSQQLSKLALEFGPLVVFFIVNSYHGIFVGTGAFMVATVAALATSKVLFGKIPLMPLISGCFIIVFGALTLFFENDTFIKMKPTIVNTMFATALFGGLFFGVSLLRYLFNEVFDLTAEGWRLLTFRWACFFVVLAVLNEIVWRSFSNDFWIGFKIFGVMPLTLVFALFQMPLLKKYDANAATPDLHDAE
ncbi:MAG: septation protein A [Pseudomonadota bacterium]